jgi:hypothetical protein
MRVARWVPVRWSMVPVDPFGPISTTAPGKADKNYLFDAASLAYVNSFQLLKVISLACMPFVSCSKTSPSKTEIRPCTSHCRLQLSWPKGFGRRIFKRSYVPCPGFQNFGFARDEISDV